MSDATNLPPTISPARPELQGIEERYRARLIKAIFGISEKVTSQLRSMVDLYGRHVSPSMAFNGDTHFPTSLRRHPNNDDHTSVSEKPNVLYFHIGNAIATYYDMVNVANRNRIVAVPSVVEARLALLEEIAAEGYDNYEVSGNHFEGYCLVHKKAAL